MTNEEKAKELAKLKDFPDSEERYYNPLGCRIYDTAIEMAEWKEEQMIERAAKWLMDNVNNYIINDKISGKDWLKVKSEIFDNFKKTMKE